jgi:2-polyprenyl-3-methyl-5-hydroxy-6-metoxy-1,4-benzoquinol methylase
MTSCRFCGAEVSVCIDGPPVLLRCRSCHLVFPERIPSSDVRRAGYEEGYYRERSGARFLLPFEWLIAGFLRLRMAGIRRREPGPGTLLDVGCGRGNLLALFRRRGWRVLGTQLSRTAAEAARHRGVEVLCGELPEMELPSGSFDVVTFYHVLEHLDRPELYLRKAAELLRTGGLLVVEAPNFASPGFRVLGARNFCLDYPNHLVFFTPSSLGNLLERSGFSIEGLSHFSLEYSPYTTLQNLLNLLPGEPSRLYRSFMGNEDGRRLRRSPLTWIHAGLALVLAAPALVLSTPGLLFPVGNTIRFHCRKRDPAM